MRLYYLIVFIISLLLSGVYFFRWQKRYDVYSVVFFTLIPIAELSYWALARSTTVGEALLATKFIYLGGCYLALFIMLCIFSACKVTLPKAVKTVLFALTTLMFAATLTGGGSIDIFYKNVSIEFIGDIAVAKKEYGFMHTVFYIYVGLTFLASLAVIIYCFFRIKNVSLYTVLMMFILEITSIVSFFFGKIFGLALDITGASYLVTQIVYLLMINRICLYDVSDNVISGLINDEKYGYISIDLNNRYLGCNETAKKIFPEIGELRLDAKISGGELGNTVSGWVEHFLRSDRSELRYNFGNKIYSVDVDYLLNKNKKVGYQLTLNDVTREQKYISLLNHYNSNLKAEVEAKTAHIEEMHDKLILGMAVMVESRDNSTGGHIRRTSDCIKILIDSIRRTGACELDEEFCKCLIKAAPMHDLGKIAVDDKILRKPGRFEPEEFEQMKTHAAKGAELVDKILEGTDDERFHSIAVNVAHYHHERMDGTGYPEGLKGEQIPLEARIMAIVDVYDALVSKRCYKDSMPFDKAFAIIDEGMGTQFDPKLRESFHAARAGLEAYYS